jgi:hypothetical protein
MKLISLFLAISAASASAQTSTYVNFVRQTQQGTGVVWDMPVAATGSAASALLLESSGSLFQLWSVDQTKVKDYLLDQKLVGAYLPKADVKITTLDPGFTVPRTRVDQPFTVEITVADLLSGAGLPVAATKVLLEQHIASYPTGSITLDPAVVAANTPASSAYITQNGKTILKFAASSLKATDPTLATGEEHFVVHALADGSITQSQLDSDKVQVFPVASGSISGLTPNQEYRAQLPTVQLNLTDLYPRSDTYFMLYEGTGVNGSTGTVVKSFPVDRDRAVSQIISVTELDSKFTKDGTYTVALMSTTVYGTELLCPPITFSVKRTISVNAMQVDYSDGSITAP